MPPESSRMVFRSCSFSSSRSRSSSIQASFRVTP